MGQFLRHFFLCPNQYILMNVCVRACVCTCVRACVCVCVWLFSVTSNISKNLGLLFTILRVRTQICHTLSLSLSLTHSLTCTHARTHAHTHTLTAHDFEEHWIDFGWSHTCKLSTVLTVLTSLAHWYVSLLGLLSQKLSKTLKTLQSHKHKTKM